MTQKTIVEAGAVNMGRWFASTDERNRGRSQTHEDKGREMEDKTDLVT